MIFTQEHQELRRTVRAFVDREINPHVDEWEKAGRFPIHEIFRKAGDLGLLGISKPEKFGGMGLDYSYSIVAAEEFGTIRCGGIPMSIGVQTDMCTPALARFGSDELREGVPAPSHQRRTGRLHRRLGNRCRLRRGRAQDTCAQGWRRLCDQRQQDVDHQFAQRRLHLPAGQHLGRQAAYQQVADHGADEQPRHQHQPAPGKTRHAQLRDRPGVFDGVRVPQRNRIGTKALAS